MLIVLCCDWLKQTFINCPLTNWSQQSPKWNQSYCGSRDFSRVFPVLATTGYAFSRALCPRWLIFPENNYNTYCRICWKFKGIKLLINVWYSFIICRLDNSGLGLLERFVEVSDGGINCISFITNWCCNDLIRKSIHVGSISAALLRAVVSERARACFPNRKSENGTEHSRGYSESLG